jgi:hypothetical protein
VNLLGWELRRHGRRVVDAVRVNPLQRLRHEHAVAAVVVPHAAGFREVVLVVGEGMRRPEQLLVPTLPVTTADPEAHVGGNLNPLPSRSLAAQCCSHLDRTPGHGARERGGGFLLLQSGFFASDLEERGSIGLRLAGAVAPYIYTARRDNARAPRSLSLRRAPQGNGRF